MRLLLRQYRPAAIRLPSSLRQEFMAFPRVDAASCRIVKSGKIRLLHRCQEKLPRAHDVALSPRAV
jgi:hypothetical protein